ncbi:MAG TPA: cyclodeaminase/cyclohydrolase family protein [Candidatus Acidoferrum sp.]|nr:cyclodeaminase/cyclohydrolase family protein [Candidatus Acidoferrum sp.]
MSSASGSLREFLEQIASAGPSGGGGAAAASTGATAAALVAMVAGVALLRAPDDAGLRQIVDEMQALRARMLALIDEDVAAFGRVVDARRRTDAARAGAVGEALLGATQVPLELASASARVLEQCAAVLPAARPSTVADLGVAAALAAAALEGAALTARANLEGLPASAFVAESRNRLAEWLRAAAALRARLPRAREESTP